MQGLKKRIVFDGEKYTDLEDPNYYIENLLGPAAQRRSKWRDTPTEELFDKNKENVKDIKEFILECKKENKPVSMLMSGINISVKKNDLSQVFFSSDKDIPWAVTIKNDEVYSELEIEERAKIKCKNKDEEDVFFDFDRTTYIINGEEINEYCSIIKPYRTERGKIEEEMIQNLVKNNSGYSLGDNGEFFRLNIGRDEVIKHENLLKGMDVREWRKKTNLEKYEDGITILKEHEEQCKYVYSLVRKAYDEIEKSKSVKLAKAQELIALSNKQNKEISELQRKVEMKGKEK